MPGIKWDYIMFWFTEEDNERYDADEDPVLNTFFDMDSPEYENETIFCSIGDSSRKEFYGNDGQCVMVIYLDGTVFLPLEGRSYVM